MAEGIETVERIRGMTREEADFIGAMNMCDEISNEAYKKIMCHCEEQEPILDKIGAEIVSDEEKWWYGVDNDCYMKLSDVLKIINKYKVKSENEK